MDNEQILKLVNAGYTKAEIDAMQESHTGDDAGAGSEPTNPPKEPSNAGEENASKIEKVGNGVDMNAAIENLTNTVASLSATVKELQNANVKGAGIEKKPAGDAIKAAMDSFIEKL